MPALMARVGEVGGATLTGENAIITVPEAPELGSPKGALPPPPPLPVFGVGFVAFVFGLMPVAPPVPPIPDPPAPPIVGPSHD